MKGYWFQDTCKECGAKFWGNAKAALRFLVCRPCFEKWTRRQYGEKP